MGTTSKTNNKPLETHRSKTCLATNEALPDGKTPSNRLTFYYITDEGKVEMSDWLRELVGAPVKEYPQFEAGLSLLPSLPADDAVEMLGKRLERLNQMIEETSAAIERATERGFHPLFLIEVDYRLKILEAERDWTRSLFRRMIDECWKRSDLVD